jgi:hypothetical protein
LISTFINNLNVPGSLGRLMRSATKEPTQAEIHSRFQPSNIPPNVLELLEH